ncbi:MAG TPA: CoA-binding protein, partial [Burkholderiaceae bacterium]|nr:CoA-binding protein [Burkholderiaceae bacterium]
MTTPAAIDFSRLFGARSIAVIGASADEKTPSGQPLMHLRNLGYSGEVYPVNPRYEAIGQWRCYPSVTALPAVPDVALVAVAAERAPAVLEECGAKGIRFVIMITSGFAEMGEAGVAAQARLLETARRHGISMIGPNCQGMINAAERFSLGFGAPYGLTYNKGGISMTSQSGAWGNAVMILANQEGLGFRHYVSTGNEAQTTSLDVVDWYLDDPQTKLVVSYVEGFQDAHRLVGIGRKALELGKPYLLWKVGTSEAGARAAASHTANLGGEMALYQAAFEQSGIIEVTDVDDLADRAHALLTGRRPGGNRVAVISMSGGAGVLMADHCAAAGLELPTLSPHTLESLRAILPAFAGLNNPIDVTGNVSAREGSFVQALEFILADPLVDMLGICLASISGPAGNQIAIDVARVCAATTKPVLVAWCADVERTREGYEALAAVGTPRYDTPVRCARGMDALWRFERARRNHEQVRAQPVLQLERPAQRQALAGLSSDLTEYQA